MKNNNNNKKQPWVVFVPESFSMYGAVAWTYKGSQDVSLH